MERPSRSKPPVVEQHIINAMATPPDTQQASQLCNRPLPALPAAPPGLSQALPASKFTTYRPRPLYKPTCSHITMTRVYLPGMTCDFCHRPGTWDWLYRCTQDLELTLFEDLRNGRKTWYDEIGRYFASQVKPAMRGPEERSDQYSFLNELSPHDLASYTPDQIATLMKQRDEVHDKIYAEQNACEHHGRHCHSTTLCTMLKGENTRPWVPKENDKCRAKVCSLCRPILADRAFLSIDGILKGDIPAEAALGWGFKWFRRRPVCSAAVMTTLGYRPVPLSPLSLSRSPSMPLSSTSTWSVEDFIEQHLSMAYQDAEGDEDPESVPEKQLFPNRSNGPFRVYQNGSVGLVHQRKVSSSGSSTASSLALEFLVRPPWTPPPTPNGEQRPGPECGERGLSMHGLPDIYDGRSPTSLKTNSEVRREVFSSVSPSSRDSDEHGFPDNSSDMAFGHHQGGNCISYWSEEAYDVGLTLRFNQDAFDRACFTSLPPPDAEEVLFFEEVPTMMEEAELEEGTFGSKPLQVAHGVAVTEESVGLGLADVITQV